MRQMRRICTAILVLLGAIIVVPAFGGTVSAHHSNIEASVACSGTVTWKASSWATGPSGTNTDILVTKTIGNNTTTITHGAFNNANNYQFTGTFTWPANTASMVISSKPIAQWGNGVISTTGSSVTIYKPANCPSQPGVTKSVSCVNTAPGNGSGTVVVTLTNDAGPYGSPVTFKVLDPDQTTGGNNYTVNSGATTPVTFTGIADGAHFVKVFVVGPPQVEKTQYFDVDCDSALPSVTKAATCANGNGEVVVTLSNAGGEAVTFKVTNPTTNVVEDVTVNANSSKTRTFSGFADGTYTVVIKVGNTDYSQTFTVDCDHPAPETSSSVVCASNDGSVTVTLSNTLGTEAVVFHITNPITNVVEHVTVGIGASTTRTYAGFSDGTHTVTITADGKDKSQTFSVQCDLAPSYSHTETCVNGDGSVDVTMKNDGDDVNAVFILNGVTYTLAPGVTQVVTIGTLTDGSHTIPLFVNGADKSFTIAVDCDRPGEPAVEIATTCVSEDGQVIVTLKNIGGQLPITFIVEGQSYSVPANSNLPVTISGVLDGPRTIAISQNGTDFSKPVNFGCDMAPTIDRTQSCVEGTGGVANGQVIVTLHNNGDDVPVTFTVNGTQYPVGPKAFVNVTVGGLADGLNHIAVSAGALDLSFDITVACDHPGEGTITTASVCANADGQLTINLTATGGELPVVFTVQGVTYSVAPNTTVPVVIAGLLDGPTPIEVHAGTKDLSFIATTECDLAPTFSYVQACADFDDTVTVTIANPGDDVAVTFVVNGTTYVLQPGETLPVAVGPLADGQNTITLVIDNVPQADIVVQSDCDPTFGIVAVCNSGSGEGTLHWFTITNTESTAVTVTWNGGSATVPAGQSTVVSTTASSLVLLHNGAQIAQAGGTETQCDKTINFTKELVGQPATGETYTIRVSRLQGATYVEETTFTINAGESKLIHLPSTMDPAGIDYKFEEIVKGSASTTTVSPDQLKVSGHLGETINVVVTNGYASVQIDKASSTPTVVPGGQITYTLQSTNTGGLTLNPVVVTDRLASNISYVSASVAGGAGTCDLTEATRPQLLTCTMSDALAPGAQTAVITVVVDVDATAVAGASILNQAMVHGAYASDAVMSGIGTGDSTLSCIPVRAGTVCDLSAQVSVPVSNSIVASSPPVPTVASDPGVVELPRTGASHIKEMLVIAFGGILLGGAMLIGRRRIGVR
jgi:uncharacterized repeat protein (TIGR01451 family)